MTAPAVPAERAFDMASKSIIVQKYLTELVKHRIGQDIFCPVTGGPLDVKKSIAIIGSDGESVLAVLSPEGWAARGALILIAAPRVNYYDPAQR